MSNNVKSGIRSEFANRVSLYNGKLSRTEKHIAQYILNHEDSIENLSIHALAQNCEVGVASIVRFSKELGYNGFADMKFQIQQGKLVMDKNDIGILKDDETNILKQKVLNYAQSYLERCIIDINNSTLESVSDAIARAGKIGIIGAGSADGIAQAAASMFMSMGLFVVSVSDPLMKLRTSAYFDSGDVFIGLSFSGYSKSVGDALYFAKENGATTVLITAYRNSLLGKYADHVLYTPARNRGNALNISTTAMGQLALLQIIQAMVYQKNIDHVMEKERRLKGNGNMQRYDVHQELISHGKIRIVKDNSNNL